MAKPSSLPVAALVAACLGFIGVLASPASAASSGPEPSSPISFGHAVPVPIGYYELCMKQPGLCRARPGRLPQTATGAVQATPALLAKLKAITERYNRSIRPVADPGTPGLWQWRADARAGNCKDYALAKRQQLLADGFPSSAALIAIVRIADGEQHAVLVIRTDRGDYVLDNLNDGVTPWREVAYRWEKIQSPSETWTWHAL